MVRKRAKVEGKGKDIFFSGPDSKVNMSTSKQDYKRFTTFLSHENIKYIKRLALEREESIYTVIAEIIEFYRGKHVDK